MRGPLGHDRRLPIAPQARPEASKIVTCLTCDSGYRAIQRGLAVLGRIAHWTKSREAEALHGHFFISTYQASRRLTWEVHCEHCHEVGEEL
jgi:hypothetical protein